MAARAQFRNRVVVPGVVSVYDGRAEGLDTSDGRWQIVCERHSTVLPVRTLAEALADARTGICDFCEECMEVLDTHPNHVLDSGSPQNTTPEEETS